MINDNVDRYILDERFLTMFREATAFICAPSTTASEVDKIKAIYAATFALLILDLKASRPINMLIFCPNCGKQHIDRPDPEIAELAELRRKDWLCSLGDKPSSMAAADMRRLMELEAMSKTFWTNPVHKSHTCRVEDGGCGLIFRIADVPTNGVTEITTKGTDDTWFPTMK